MPPSFRLAGLTIWAEAAPIILDSQQQTAPLKGHLHPDRSGLGVLFDVVEGLLHDAKEIQFRGGRTTLGKAGEAGFHHQSAMT